MSVLSFCCLSEAQCLRLIQDSAALESRAGLLYGGMTLGSPQTDATRYKAREAFIDLQAPFEWLRGVLQSALNCGAKRYQTSPLSLVEMPRVLSYDTGSHFDWHVDAPPGHLNVLRTPRRQLTASIQLSGPHEYLGGDLLVEHDGQVETAPRSRGSVVLFPAGWRHKVAPVTGGVRSALVVWGY